MLIRINKVSAKFPDVLSNLKNFRKGFTSFSQRETLGVAEKNKDQKETKKKYFTNFEETFDIINENEVIESFRDYIRRGKHNVADLIPKYPQRSPKKKADPKTFTTVQAKRKQATAEVRIRKGNDFVVNGKPLHEYFNRLECRANAVEPLLCTRKVNDYEIICKVNGGGRSGQSKAVSTALAKAIRKREFETWEQIVESSRIVPDYGSWNGELKEIQLLALSDPRRRERKKIGKLRARKGQRYRRR